MPKGEHDAMPLGPFEMPDDQWALMLKLIRFKMEEDGLTAVEDGVRLIKKFWLIINDMSAMELIDNENTLDQLRALRDNQDTNRADLDAEIARLEGLLGL